MPAVVDYENRYQLCWEALVKKQQEFGLGKFAETNPVGVVQSCLRDQQLGDNTAKLLSTEFLTFLDSLGVLNPIRGHGKGVQPIIKFQLSQLELPNLSTFLAKFQKSTNGHNGGGNAEVLAQLTALTQQVAELKKAPTAAITPSKIAHMNTFAIWIDTCNLFHESRKIGFEEPPIKSILHYFCQQIARRAFGAAFFNLNASEEIIRPYVQHGLVPITCIFPKETKRLDTREIRLISDPVDLQMITTIKELVDVAPIHVVVSGDHDMEPVINILKGQRKEVHRVFINQGRKAILTRSDCGTFEIPNIERTTSQRYGRLAITV